MIKQILVLGMIFSSAMLFGQKNTQGFYLGAALTGGKIYYDEENVDDSDVISGMDLRLGYGVTKTTTLFFGVGGYSVAGDEADFFRENYAAAIAELGAKFHFGSKQKSPIFYLEASLQGVVADYSEDFELTLKGAGLGIGGGVMFYIGDVLSIDVGLRGSSGAINSIDFGGVSFNLDDENFKYGLSRFNVGISWYPFRKNQQD